jgi:hypothetical protein
MPNEGFKPEELIAYEVVYRVRLVGALYVTVSGFFNRLEHTLSTEVLTPFAEPTPAPAHLVVPVQFANGLHGTVRARN